MYPDAFTIERLAKELDDLLKNRCIETIFSTSKTKLYFGFDISTGIEVEFYKGQAFFRFPLYSTFPKANRLKQFSNLENQKIKTVNPHPNSRSFDIEFMNSVKLVFKLYGQHSNVISYGTTASELFCSDYPKDLQLPIENFTQPHLTQNQTFNNALGLINANSNSDAFACFDSIKKKLSENDPIHYEAFKTYYLTQPLHGIKSEGGDFQLSCFPDPNSHKTYACILQAFNDFTNLHIVNESFTSTKSEQLREAEHALQQTKSRINRLEISISELSQWETNKQIGDIILANQSNINTGENEVELYDFYNQNLIKITLDPELSPQKNASLFYLKAKGNLKELNFKQNELLKKKSELVSLIMKFEAIEQAENSKILKSYATKKEDVQKQLIASLPYRAYKLEDFNVMVGKNAKSNDEMLSKYSSKNDLWLHAKDVSGSHVVIKNKSGAQIPSHIIEQAAALAAWHSKAKNQSLASVVYTFRKYVRKGKGMAPGQVFVERETGLLVKPKDFK